MSLNVLNKTNSNVSRNKRWDGLERSDRDSKECSSRPDIATNASDSPLSHVSILWLYLLIIFPHHPILETVCESVSSLLYLLDRMSMNIYIDWTGFTFRCVSNNHCICEDLQNEDIWIMLTCRRVAAIVRACIFKRDCLRVFSIMALI
jgi:hypothetical protein